MARKVSKKRELRQKENALVLFGSKGKMETPEQRENAALVLKLSEDQRIKALANLVLNPEFKFHSFVWCMDYLGVPLSLVCHEYKELQRHHGYILAATKLPEIMDRVSDRALAGDPASVEHILEAFDITGKGRSGPLVNLDMRRIGKDENLEDLAATIGPLLNGETT